MKQCVSVVTVAISLMREAMTLLDEPDAATVVHYLRLAIDMAEQIAQTTEQSRDEGKAHL